MKEEIERVIYRNNHKLSNSDIQQLQLMYSFIENY